MRATISQQLEYLGRIKLILLDIDGTLVVGSKVEVDHVRRQLSRLTRLGIHFSVATGRTLFGTKQVLADLGARGRAPFIVAYNGAIISRPDASPWIERRILEPDALKFIAEICSRRAVPLLAYTCRQDFSLRYPEQVFGDYRQFPEDAVDFNGMLIERVDNFGGIPFADVVALLISVPEEVADAESLANAFRDECGPRVRITTSGGRYVEITHPLSTKRDAMVSLCARLGLRTEEVMAIGDNYNDLEMITDCGFGVAVANSPPAVKDASRFVCKHGAAGGVVEVLRMLAEYHRRGTRRRRVDDEL